MENELDRIMRLSMDNRRCTTMGNIPRTAMHNKRRTPIQSQRDCVSQLKVAATPLPWEPSTGSPANPNGVAYCLDTALAPPLPAPRLPAPTVHPDVLSLRTDGLRPVPALEEPSCLRIGHPTSSTRWFSRNLAPPFPDASVSEPAPIRALVPNSNRDRGW